MSRPSIEIDYVLSTSDEHNVIQTNAVRSTTVVYCSFQLAGLHCWPECPHEEVYFLRFLHRHMFHFRCHKTVDHSNRSTEFIILKNQITKYLVDTYWDGKFNCCNFGHRSCEMIAEELCSEFNLCQAEVSEDGENGGIVYREHI